MMRRQSTLIYLIFGAIIAIFAINFGPGSVSCRRMRNGGVPWVASVHGDMIRQQELALAYNRQLDRMRRNAEQSGFDITEEMAEKFGLRQQVLDQLIDRRLLSHEGIKRGIVISDTELAEFLRTQFGVENVTHEQYQNWVERVFQQSISEFEEEMRQELIAQRMARLLTDTVSLSDAEVRDMYVKDRNRVMLNYVKFDPPILDMPKPTADAVDALLKAEASAVDARYQQDKARFDADKKAPEAAKREVASLMLQERSAQQFAQRKAQELLHQLQAGKKLEALTYTEDEAAAALAGSGARPERRETPWLHQDDTSVPRVGLSPELIADAFQLSDEHAVSDKVYAIGRSYYVVVLKQKETANMADFDQQKATLREQAAFRKKNDILKEWLQHIRKSEHVELNPEFALNSQKASGGAQ